MLRLFERLLLLWLLIGAGVAYVWPEWIQPRLPEAVAVDPFTKQYTDHYLNPLLAVAMFAIGWMLPRDEVDLVFGQWRNVLLGTAIQYTSMPLLALFFGWLLALPEAHFRGLVLVGCVPGAMASNVLTLAARGNTSYSVMLTSSSTILSPIAVPLGLYLVLGASGGDAWLYLSAALFLLLTVVLPVSAGHLLGRWRPEWEEWAKPIGSLVANITILVIIAAVVGLNRGKIAAMLADGLDSDWGWRLLVALIGLNLGGFAAGYFGGWALRQDEPMRRALTIEIGMQNAGLGALLAQRLFQDQPESMLAPALFTFGCMFSGTTLATLWAWSDDLRGASPEKNPEHSEAT